MRTIDAAKFAGATYADVRITRSIIESWWLPGTTVRNFGIDMSRDSGESLAIGVRALVNGCWGFAASPYWNADEAVLLAHEAVSQATYNARATPRRVEFTPIPVASGHWNTPIEVDPFTVPLEERRDLVDRWGGVAGNLRRTNGDGKLYFDRQERAVATTEGAYFTQTLYTIAGLYDFDDQLGTFRADVPVFVGAGWEALRDAPVLDQLLRVKAEADAKNRQPVVKKPGNIGRYDVVCSASVMGQLLAQTLGPATELDRAMGYEADATGTSFLSDPLAMLETYHVASPLVTVTANRSEPQGLATVKWDDEGVEPEDITLVRDGVLMDYQTTREQASWLAPYYEKHGRAVRSHGHAGADEALSITMQRSPNLALAPGKEDLSFDDFVKDTKKGIAVLSANITTDFQLKNGSSGFTGNGLLLREIVDGKLGAQLTGLSFLFNTMELWKNVLALGGPGSSERQPSSSVKGQPVQSTRFTVHAVPAKIKNISFIDPVKKA
jgi:TldD protein